MVATSSCSPQTRGGIVTHNLTHPDLPIPDPSRSIEAAVSCARRSKYNVDTWDGRLGTAEIPPACGIAVTDTVESSAELNPSVTVFVCDSTNF